MSFLPVPCSFTNGRALRFCPRQDSNFSLKEQLELDARDQQLNLLHISSLMVQKSDTNSLEVLETLLFVHEICIAECSGRISLPSLLVLEHLKSLIIWSSPLTDLTKLQSANLEKLDVSDINFHKLPMLWQLPKLATLCINCLHPCPRTINWTHHALKNIKVSHCDSLNSFHVWLPQAIALDFRNCCSLQELWIYAPLVKSFLIAGLPCAEIVFDTPTTFLEKFSVIRCSFLTRLVNLIFTSNTQIVDIYMVQNLVIPYPFHMNGESTFSLWDCDFINFPEAGTQADLTTSVVDDVYLALPEALNFHFLRWSAIKEQRQYKPFIVE